MNKITEKQLLAHAKKGELAAFEELVAAYEHPVFAFAFRFCDDSAAAQKLTQDVFLSIYTALSSAHTENNFALWVYRTMLQLCLQNAAASKKITDILFEDAVRTQTPFAPATLAVALSQLSVESRNILLLRDVIGLTYSEIAQLLTLEETSIKLQLAKARRQLVLALQSETPTSLDAAEGSVLP